MKAGLQRGQCLSGIFHVNQNNKSQGFVRAEKLPVDIFIDGMVKQNRSIEGDQVGGSEANNRNDRACMKELCVCVCVCVFAVL